MPGSPEDVALSDASSPSKSPSSPSKSPSGLAEHCKSLWRFGEVLQGGRGKQNSCQRDEELLQFLEEPATGDGVGNESIRKESDKELLEFLEAPVTEDSDVGNESSSKLVDESPDGGLEATKENLSPAPAAYDRGSLDLLATSVISFGKMLQSLELKYEEQKDANQYDIARFLRKVEGLQDLCRDTAAMGMQHAEAVLGMGFRIDVLEKQLAHVLDDKAPSEASGKSSSPRAIAASLPSLCGASTQTLLAASEAGQPEIKSCTAPAESSASCATQHLSAFSNSSAKAYADLQQQYAETALKVYGQVSSIETRVNKLEPEVMTRLEGLLQRVAQIEGVLPLAPSGKPLLTSRQNHASSPIPAAHLQAQLARVFEGAGLAQIQPGLGQSQIQPGLAQNLKVQLGQIPRQANSPNVERRQSQPGQSRTQITLPHVQRLQSHPALSPEPPKERPALQQCAGPVASSSDLGKEATLRSQITSPIPQLHKPATTQITAPHLQCLSSQPAVTSDHAKEGLKSFKSQEEIGSWSDRTTERPSRNPSPGPPKLVASASVSVPAGLMASLTVPAGVPAGQVASLSVPAAGQASSPYLQRQDLAKDKYEAKALELHKQLQQQLQQYVAQEIQTTVAAEKLAGLPRQSTSPRLHSRQPTVMPDAASERAAGLPSSQVLSASSGSTPRMSPCPTRSHILTSATGVGVSPAQSARHLPGVGMVTPRLAVATAKAATPRTTSADRTIRAVATPFCYSNVNHSNISPSSRSAAESPLSRGRLLSSTFPRCRTPISGIGECK